MDPGISFGLALIGTTDKDYVHNKLIYLSVPKITINNFPQPEAMPSNGMIFHPIVQRYTFYYHRRLKTANPYFWTSEFNYQSCYMYIK